MSKFYSTLFWLITLISGIMLTLGMIASYVYDRDGLIATLTIGGWVIGFIIIFVGYCCYMTGENPFSEESLGRKLWHQKERNIRKEDKPQIPPWFE